MTLTAAPQPRVLIKKQPVVVGPAAPAPLPPGPALLQRWCQNHPAWRYWLEVPIPSPIYDAPPKWDAILMGNGHLWVISFIHHNGHIWVTPEDQEYRWSTTPQTNSSEEGGEPTPLGRWIHRDAIHAKKRFQHVLRQKFGILKWPEQANAMVLFTHPDVHLDAIPRMVHGVDVMTGSEMEESMLVHDQIKGSVKHETEVAAALTDLQDGVTTPADPGSSQPATEDLERAQEPAPAQDNLGAPSEALRRSRIPTLMLVGSLLIGAAAFAAYFMQDSTPSEEAAIHAEALPLPTGSVPAGMDLVALLSPDTARTSLRTALQEHGAALVEELPPATEVYSAHTILKGSEEMVVVYDEHNRFLRATIVYPPNQSDAQQHATLDNIRTTVAAGAQGPETNTDTSLVWSRSNTIVRYEPGHGAGQDILTIQQRTSESTHN